MIARPALVWIGATVTVGPEAAIADLFDHLVAGRTSDDWAEEFLELTPVRGKWVYVPPLKETLRSWKKRRILDSDTFDRLADELKGQAGRLVDVWNTRFVELIYGSLFDVIVNGSTLSDWIPEAQALLDRFGADQAIRIFSGEKWSPSYAELFFRNANAAATAGGRYAEMFSRQWIGLAPFWLYDAVDDTRTRPAHAALDGMVFRKDDSTARRLLPPSAHNCRCAAREYTQRDVETGGHTITSSDALSKDVFPERGWDADRVESLVPGTLKNLPRGAA